MEKLSIIAIEFLILILIVRPDNLFLLHAFVFRLIFRKKKWGKYGALLLLPNEVLFEAFKFLNRRQLTNLERVCPRFHRIISDHIGEAPFLRLDCGFRLCKDCGFRLFKDFRFRLCKCKRFLLFLPFKY